MAKMPPETLSITESAQIAHIELGRPDKANAIDGAMWDDLRSAFAWLDSSTARVGVLSGRGRHFTAGIDPITACNVHYPRRGPAEAPPQ